MSTRRDDLKENAPRFDLLALLRDIERSYPDKPRIGKAPVTGQEIVKLGQDPFMAFPASNIQSVHMEPGKTMEVRSQFLGFFGPQGALPLLTTMEAMRWMAGRDDSFVRFTDIFATRFLQLFFRAWADARPIAQFDRPEEDRFADYVGSFIGVGSDPYKDRDRVDDIAKLQFAGILAGRVKSASRLRQVLKGVLGVDVEIRERVGVWLEFEDSDLSRLGQQGADLGQNTYAGARAYSINDKAVIEIRTKSLEEYRSFLPGGPQFIKLSDIVHFYLGTTVDFDIELGLPGADIPAAQLGQAGQLGYTSWAAPSEDLRSRYVSDATFRLTRAGG